MAEHPKPRLLIEEWLPAAAVGVESIRERQSAVALMPHTYLHVWWARRPLVASRAAILGSLLPEDFPRSDFEKLIGLYSDSKTVCSGERQLNEAKALGLTITNPHGPRACTSLVPKDVLDRAQLEIKKNWGEDPVTVIDPMAGGGSIPLESSRYGFRTIANEYNSVACSVLEATLIDPALHGKALSERTLVWGGKLLQRFRERMAPFYGKPRDGIDETYIFANTVPCPDSGFYTPLVPDWHLLKPKKGTRVVTVPVIDKLAGTWSVDVKLIGRMAGELLTPPQPTYSGGQGISVFSGRPISRDWINQKAQMGEMRAALYAIAYRTTGGVQFRAPSQTDLAALEDAERELVKLTPQWTRENTVPTEAIPAGEKTKEPAAKGMTSWADLFSKRQLLAMGVLVEELRLLRKEIVASEGEVLGEAVVHLLSFVTDKLANYNSKLCSWHAPRAVMRSVFDRHDLSFKVTFAELAAASPGTGLEWVLKNVVKASRELAGYAEKGNRGKVEVTKGSATTLPGIRDKELTAVVVDPPYDDNVQYSELADFFYVWLKRTQGHRRPEWFGSYLCEHDQEAVVNETRHHVGGEPPKFAKERARKIYRQLMMETFRESRRVLRDDGVLTVMFTHKKQEAWEALFSSLVQAGFVITATWPVKTESEHSLHQAKKNAAQSTVILVARKRPAGSGKGYFTGEMQDEIRGVARASAIRLQEQGLNAVDQLVGSFGPAMEVYSRFDQVVTDTGVPVAIGEALDIASDAVSSWRVEQLAAKGLDGVEAEGRFALLCWDVLGAEEFRFNEAKLLGHAVGMDVESLVVAGLVTKSGDKIKMVSARDRKREEPLKPEEIQTLFGTVVLAKKGKKKDVLKVHPGDAGFRTALDACHAMAIEYIEGRDPQRGIALVKALSRRHGWTKDSDAVRLMEALVVAAPDGVRFDRGKTSAGAQFPEFRAWHHMLGEVFGLEQPEWKMKVAPKTLFDVEDDADDEEEEGDEE